MLFAKQKNQLLNLMSIINNIRCCKITLLSIIFIQANTTSGSTRIKISTTAGVKIEKISTINDGYFGASVEINGKTCQLSGVNTFENYTPKLSSDGYFLIPSASSFISILKLLSCNNHTSVPYIEGRLQDVNFNKNILVRYILPNYDINQLHGTSVLNDYLIEVININEKNKMQPIIIYQKPFFYKMRSSRDMAKFAFATPSDSAIFSSNGKYLAPLARSISCKKGAYPGVFETTHWKQVIFNGPDSNKKCRALFPQLK
jgi:hypothetical protein